ncbi:hypothetical protein CG709_16085, partial [Lachnotalea glycerini]
NTEDIEDKSTNENSEVIMEAETGEEIEIPKRQMTYNSVDNLMIPSLYDGTYLPNQCGTLPTSYDSRTYGYVTPVRNQGTWGTCWAFSAIGVAEANIVKKGLAGNTLDLSELQLAYFFYHTVTDPLGNTEGDSTKAVSQSYLNRGGNSAFTTFALAGWCGTALESKAPYENASENLTLDSSLAYDDAYHMQNAFWVNMTDRSDVKQLIMNYGAISTSYLSDQTSNDSTTYYNSTNKAYYYDGRYSSNHAIIIVGWDDSFSKTKFNQAHRPSSNGAWLVKNSWGTSFGDSGYFWISYEDAAFNDSDYSQAFVFDFEAADNYDHNYQYDGSNGTYAYSVYNGGSIANIFTASGNPGKKETINAVSFALYDVNVNYSIQIYKNPTNANDPTSGTAMLTKPKTGQTSYVGYYTVPLSDSITIKDGEKFSVVVTLSKRSSNYVNYFCDYSYNNGNWIKFTSEMQSGQSFQKYWKNASWEDMSADQMTPRIKAFTTNAN